MAYLYLLMVVCAFTRIPNHSAQFSVPSISHTVHIFPHVIRCTLTNLCATLQWCTNKHKKVGGRWEFWTTESHFWLMTAISPHHCNQPTLHTCRVEAQFLKLHTFCRRNHWDVGFVHRVVLWTLDNTMFRKLNLLSPSGEDGTHLFCRMP
jgi:hypothetical protein